MFSPCGTPAILRDDLGKHGEQVEKTLLDAMRSVEDTCYHCIEREGTVTSQSVNSQKGHVSTTEYLLT